MGEETTSPLRLQKSGEWRDAGVDTEPAGVGQLSWGHRGLGEQLGDWDRELAWGDEK